MRRKICVVTLFLVFIGQIVMAGGNTADFKYGKWHLKYTLSTGSAEYIYQGKTVFDKVGTGVSGTYTEYEIGQEEITDGFGTGMCFTVTRSGENLPSVIYNPQIQISEKSQTKRLKIADSRKTKRPIIDKRTTPNKRHSNAIITL